ncbi:MAG: thiamine pyrophosphate-binding protein [Candidatus Helarchaeota archaeon]|nr:thiamine pyrophosphate-binding protein [Candidatus Helarchaeota archaeon]
MVTMKGNKAIAKALAQNGVEYIFGICGTSVAGFLSALGKEKGIKYIVARHERSAGSMADGYARASGKVGVCQMHSGPGTLNGMLSIADAYRDSSPVVLLAGQVARKYIGREIFGEANQVAVLRSYTKACLRIEDVTQIPKIINNAFHSARSGHPGPVMVEMPEDIYDSKGELEEALPIASSIPSISPPIIQDAAERLLHAERPVILAGGGVIWANASEPLKYIAEMLQIPVTTTQNGRGCFPEDHSLALGVSGWYGGNSIADDALEDADVILGVGCSFSSLTTYNFTTPLKADIIHINIDPSILGKNAACKYGITGDANTVLLELIRVLDSKDMSRRASNWIESLAQKKQAWAKQLEVEMDSASTPIKPQRLMKDIQKTIPKESIVLNGAGLHHLFITTYLQRYYPRTYISAINLGSMGFAFPAALGAKAACPEVPVICLIGDGDFMMSLPDLETAVRNRFNVITVILNNFGYHAPKRFQQLNFGTDFGNDYSNPDFAKVAVDFGAVGRIVERPGEVVELINEALICATPTVIDARIDPTVIPAMNIKAASRLRGLKA